MFHHRKIGKYKKQIMQLKMIRVLPLLKFQSIMTLPIILFYIKY